MYPQQLTKIVERPFYRGVLVHGTREGKAVEGDQGRLAPELFPEVNSLQQKACPCGVPLFIKGSWQQF